MTDLGKKLTIMECSGLEGSLRITVVKERAGEETQKGSLFFVRSLCDCFTPTHSGILLCLKTPVALHNCLTAVAKEYVHHLIF
jgi:hypothetical protein